MGRPGRTAGRPLARRRRSHGLSGPNGRPTAGRDGRSLSVLARMSLVFGGLRLWPAASAPQSGPPGASQRAELRLGCHRSRALFSFESADTPRHQLEAIYCKVHKYTESKTANSVAWKLFSGLTSLRSQDTYEPISMTALFLIFAPFSGRGGDLYPRALPPGGAILELAG